MILQCVWRRQIVLMFASAQGVCSHAPCSSGCSRGSRSGGSDCGRDQFHGRARSYIDYIRRGGGGTPGGPAAARLVYAANRKLCSVHCHKARRPDPILTLSCAGRVKPLPPF